MTYTIKIPECCNCHPYDKVLVHVLQSIINEDFVNKGKAYIKEKYVKQFEEIDSILANSPEQEVYSIFPEVLLEYLSSKDCLQEYFVKYKKLLESNLSNKEMHIAGMLLFLKNVSHRYYNEGDIPETVEGEVFKDLLKLADEAADLDLSVMEHCYWRIPEGFFTKDEFEEFCEFAYNYYSTKRDSYLSDLKEGIARRAADLQHQCWMLKKQLGAVWKDMEEQLSAVTVKKSVKRRLNIEGDMIRETLIPVFSSFNENICETLSGDMSDADFFTKLGSLGLVARTQQDNDEDDVGFNFTEEVTGEAIISLPPGHPEMLRLVNMPRGFQNIELCLPNNLQDIKEAYGDDITEPFIGMLGPICLVCIEPAGGVAQILKVNQGEQLVTGGDGVTNLFNARSDLLAFVIKNTSTSEILVEGVVGNEPFELTDEDLASEDFEAAEVIDGLQEYCVTNNILINEEGMISSIADYLRQRHNLEGEIFFVTHQ